MKPGIVNCPDGVPRCWWGTSPEIYQAYHDHEWGMPVSDSFRLFEKICLEGFQSGLSWLTILKKRDHFRKVFADFDFHRVAEFGDAEIEALVADPGIIRHRGKIVSAIHNARLAIALEAEFGTLAEYFARFEPPSASRPRRIIPETVATLSKTAESIALSKDLRKRGWSFVGPTTCYAFMQAMGLVNDHLEGCAARERVEEARMSRTQGRKRLASKRPRP